MYRALTSGSVFSYTALYRFLPFWYGFSSPPSSSCSGDDVEKLRINEDGNTDVGTGDCSRHGLCENVGANRRHASSVFWKKRDHTCQVGKVQKRAISLLILPTRIMQKRETFIVYTREFHYIFVCPITFKFWLKFWTWWYFPSFQWLITPHMTQTFYHCTLGHFADLAMHSCHWKNVNAIYMYSFSWEKWLVGDDARKRGTLPSPVREVYV